MGHAAHFLSRLDRFGAVHVEQALALYRDDVLLKTLLDHADLPKDVERVAISLRDSVDGPFIVVTREGRFVTCLGEGMPARGLPVVTRAGLDAATSRVRRLRGALAHLAGFSAEGTRRRAPAGPPRARRRALRVRDREPCRCEGGSRPRRCCRA